MSAYIQVGIANSFPITMLCIDNGNIAFQPTQQFKAIIDGNVVWAADGFSIDGEDYKYGEQICYKEIPSMLQWLKQQNLISPF